MRRWSSLLDTPGTTHLTPGELTNMLSGLGACHGQHNASRMQQLKQSGAVPPSLTHAMPHNCLC